MSRLVVSEAWICNLFIARRAQKSNTPMVLKKFSPYSWQNVLVAVYLIKVSKLCLVYNKLSLFGQMCEDDCCETCC